MVRVPLSSHHDASWPSSQSVLTMVPAARTSLIRRRRRSTMFSPMSLPSEVTRIRVAEISRFTEFGTRLQTHSGLMSDRYWTDNLCGSVTCAGPGPTSLADLFSPTIGQLVPQFSRHKSCHRSIRNPSRALCKRSHPKHLATKFSCTLIISRASCERCNR